MTSRRKFIATSTVAALTGAFLPKPGGGDAAEAPRGGDGGRGHGGPERDRAGDVIRPDATRPAEERARKGSATLRRLRGRAALGQSVPRPES